MRRKLNWVLAALVLAAACDREAVTYKQPPAGSYTTGTRRVKIGNAIVAVDGASVTPEFFRAIGVPPLLGRFFLVGDRKSQAPPVVVLSYAIWKERFNAAPEITGRTIEIDGHAATVVGIAPRGFSLPGSTQIWTPK